MGLIILIVTGALLGWLATIALQIDDGRGILRNVVAGIIGSLGVGLATSGGVFLGAIRASTLLWAAVGAIVLIGLYNVVREKALS
ncbi:GlsB/YeaQ/YmgE family stress response membrane protein [Qipengyuania gelatinilytica]|uniref:GlsB/YeaQ/YmgE family stress response membrane protein n=1 Tax=Qipengyuania gelatinilytica TaxID=2867231 RepID=A0ABX9A7Z8_9SPHN|nr:GlsB/YeaQ/YmgE family stress response membrane protein [Qipengyuania gelatinilytica]QZD96404.1 GlsB/YeaQ/YmgE family stress response membrane protein [Qipengyuania gelatinilytica]